MKRFLYLFSIIIFFAACKSSRKTVTVTPKKQRVTASPDVGSKTVTKKENKVSKKTDNIIKTALSYNGTRYKYGGTSRKGMDCSGLIYTSFITHDVLIQRTSGLMAKEGKKINLNDAQKGDLLFFRTNKKNNRINHVGLIVSINDNDVKFIHSTTSRGVIVSSIKEGYWNYAFVEARRVL